MLIYKAHSVKLNMVFYLNYKEILVAESQLELRVTRYLKEIRISFENSFKNF